MYSTQALQPAIGAPPQGAQAIQPIPPPYIQYCTVYEYTALFSRKQGGFDC